jgi:hypothetical protein
VDQLAAAVAAAIAPSGAPRPGVKDNVQFIIAFCAALTPYTIMPPIRPKVSAHPVPRSLVHLSSRKHRGGSHRRLTGNGERPERLAHQAGELLERSDAEPRHLVLIGCVVQTNWLANWEVLRCFDGEVQGLEIRSFGAFAGGGSTADHVTMSVTPLRLKQRLGDTSLLLR